MISQLLELLPRAQYVGYTATPFANVFIDPSDAQDIFPTDYLISLPRPAGYMGVQDFHDLDADEHTYANSQELAHVRGIHDEEDDRLQEAMDAFVLSGVLKLYRAGNGPPDEPFRHHTMLVHESVRINDHAELALRTNTMWHEAGYASLAGRERLAALFDADFAPVSEARADGLPTPTQQADTLMQMGRWFGSRPGCRDLVRLYIGRTETYGRGRTADLYEAFEAICHDEEEFRASSPATRNWSTASPS